MVLTAVLTFNTIMNKQKIWSQRIITSLNKDAADVFENRAYKTPECRQNKRLYL